MKGKLIKQDGYKLYVDDVPYATSHNSPYKRLSLKNCEAIERGYDLDELAKNYLLNKWLPNTNKEDRELWYLTNDWSKEVVKIIKNFYIELMGDKKYSEEDIHEVYYLGEREDRSGFHDLLHLKQQTEWDVEIEMEEVLYTNEYIPKLDKNGFLILKRI